MNKAEKFISEHTRKLTQCGDDYFLWITPDDARKAVEIAREEMMEKGIEFLKDHLDGIPKDDIERSIETFKLAMEE